MSVFSKLNYFVYSQFWPGKLNGRNRAGCLGTGGMDYIQVAVKDKQVWAGSNWLRILIQFQ